jgi:hypothetical protein
MVGFSGNKDVGARAGQISDTASLAKSLRYQPDHFNKFRRGTQQQTASPSIDVGSGTITSAYGGNNRQRAGVVTTLNMKDDATGDAYAKHLKKLTSHYRKGVLHMSGTMGELVPSCIHH